MAKHKKASKKPVVAASPTPKKRPIWFGPTPHEGRAISWRFSTADAGGPFSWSNLPPDRLPYVLGKLSDFERMDQNALRECRHTHALPDSVSGEAWKRLCDTSRDDLERLFSFHLGGKERVWCADYAGEGVMFVLWWDPEHAVYAVKKKHT